MRSEIRKAWDRHRLRRSSLTSVNQSQYRYYRSSSEGRGSETNNIGAFLRKYRPAVKKVTSATDLEEVYPFHTGNKQYETVQDRKLDLTEKKYIINETNSDTNDKNTMRDKSNDDIREITIDKGDSEVSLKINILTIQYRSSSRDKMSRNVSTVDIETLQNGTTIKEASYTNTEEDIADESEGLAAENETFFLVT